MELVFGIKRLDGACGGAERIFCAICNQFAQKEYKVTIISFDKPDARSFYPLSPHITWIKMDLGIAKCKTSIYEFWLRTNALRKFLQKSQATRIIGFMHSFYVPLALASIGTNKIVIASEHISIDHYNTRPLEKLLLFIVSFFLNKITVVSRDVMQAFPWLLRRKMQKIENPVEIREVKKRREYKKKHRNTLLNIGRLTEQKDQLTLIRAFGLIAQKFPTWDLKIIGEGKLKQNIQAEVFRLNLEGRVILCDQTPDIFAEYYSADIFVNSSLYESFGLCTAEAMVSGLPTVGFKNCPGTNELISHEENGLLVETGNRVENLSQTLSVLMGDQNYRLHLGKNGRKLISSKHSIETVFLAWERLLHGTEKTQ